MGPKTNRIGSLARRLYLALGACLLLAAAALAAGNLREQRAAREASSALLALTEQRMADIAPPTPAGAGAPQQDPSGLPAWAAWEVDGILSIPSLDLRLPVLADFDEERLKVSVCAYERWEEGTSERLVIAGHNYASHFGALSSLREGAEVSYQLPAGEVTEYRVTGIEEIPSDDHGSLEAGQWDITLLTCNWDMSKRILVRLERANLAPGEES